MPTTVHVVQSQAVDPLAFEVTVEEGRGRSRHQVTMAEATYRKLAAFEFLLDREPKESILGAFDVSVIARYFPEFEAELGKCLPGGAGG